ncbi:MAG: type VII toxin-antitoxin system HepT family RNase toxin [Dictyoglomus turgidum]
MLQFNREKISKLLKDPDKVDSAKYNFIVAIESAIDICNHTISRNGLRPPKDYSDTLRVLFENGFWEKEFFENLVNMAKLRNRLVHIYCEIDN